MKRLLASLSLLALLLLPSATVAAYNPLDAACQSGGAAQGSAACSADGSDPISGTHGALKKASLIIATIAGVAAVIIIIVAGLEYITSAGDSKKAAGARSAIIGSVVGLVIIVASESILLFVISRI